MTFPSRYWCTIGLRRVFSLGGWSRRIHTGFHVPRATQGSGYEKEKLRVRGCHPLRPNFPDRSARFCFPMSPALQPRRGRNPCGLGCSPVARHYWGNHSCFLFLQVLRCFSSLRLPPCSSRDLRPSAGGVAPFGHPRINGRMHLPAAFRSLPRPSSPSGAKASAVRPFLLSACGDVSLRMSCSSRRISPSGLYAIPQFALVKFCLLWQYVNDRLPHMRRKKVENNGFEPLTPCVQSRCSSQLS